MINIEKEDNKRMMLEEMEHNNWETGVDVN